MSKKSAVGFDERWELCIAIHLTYALVGLIRPGRNDTNHSHQQLLVALHSGLLLQYFGCVAKA